MKRYYLAYGSNLNIEQMKHRCPTAKVFGTAVIEDYELLFKGSLTGSYLTIEKKKGAKVPVGVWSVEKRDEAALDRYEGYPSFYYKKDIRLTVKNLKTGEEKEMDTFVYIMHEDRKLGMPSPYYVETCSEGYDAFGFDKQLLIDAIRKSEGGYQNGE